MHLCCGYSTTICSTDNHIASIEYVTNDNPVFCPNRLFFYHQWWGWSWMISTLMHCDPGTSWGYFRLAMIHDVNNYLHNYIYMYIFIRCNYSSIPRWFRHNSCNFTKRQLKLYSVITITSHRNIWIKSLTCGLNSENSGNKRPLALAVPDYPMHTINNITRDRLMLAKTQISITAMALPIQFWCGHLNVSKGPRYLNFIIPIQVSLQFPEMIVIWCFWADGKSILDISCCFQRTE